MNTFKKVYCRLYQRLFWMLSPVLPYTVPKCLNDVAKVPLLLTELGVNRVLLVTDKGLRGCGATASLETALQTAGIGCAVYDGTCPNPTVCNVEEARALYRLEGCEAIIAFGGGSPMDCAKGVGARIAYPKKSLSELKGLLKVRRKIPPLIAIPTTAGTGSEVTVTAVITDSDKKFKYTMNDFPLIPPYAVLDPKVTLSLPPHLTATTGMDALTHAVEAYIGRSNTAFTKGMAKEAVRLIFENLEKAYTTPNDLTAREQMLMASHKAGLAFSRAYVGYVHAIAHSLGGQYNIPHGLANAVLLPHVLEAYGASAHKKLFELALVAGIAEKQDTPKAGAEKFISAIREMNNRMNIPTTLGNILPEDIPLMADHAEKEANPLYPVPKLMDKEDLAFLYTKVTATPEN